MNASLTNKVLAEVATSTEIAWNDLPELQVEGVPQVLRGFVPVTQSSLLAIAEFFMLRGAEIVAEELAAPPSNALSGEVTRFAIDHKLVVVHEIKGWYYVVGHTRFFLGRTNDEAMGVLKKMVE